MTNHPQLNLLQADLERPAAQKASRLRLLKTILAATAASLSVTFAVSQTHIPAVKLSFARMDSSATLHRPPPLASINKAPAVIAAPTDPRLRPQVLGLLTTTQPSASAAGVSISADQITQLIQQTLQQYINSGQFTGPQGQAGPPGPPGPSSSGVVQNNNGQSTAVIGGNPIVTYVPAQPQNNFTGTTLAGFGQLSAQSLTAGLATLTGNLTGTGATFSGGLTVSGQSTLATSTLSSLTVSGPASAQSLTVTGPATFTGSTTIAGLTVTGLNPGLTQGSIAFQGASGLTQDNSNFFYDSTNHRLGLGTTTPVQTLTIIGTVSVSGSTTTQSLAVTGTSTLATTTATALTATGSSSLATTTVTGFSDSGAATIIGSTTISSLAAGPVRSTALGSLYNAAVNLSTGDVTGVLAAGNGGTGTSTLGSLTVGSNLSITGGQSILIGTSTQISLGSNVVTSTTNDTNVTGSIAANTLTLGWTGTLAAGRLNGNVVQAVTNDTNLTGSISAQNLTLGWTGQLAVSRGGTGMNTLTQYALLAGNNTGAIATITPGTTFQVLRSAGSSAYPVYSDIGSLLTAGSNIQVTGTSTLAVVSSPSFTGTTTVATLTTTGNVGIGTTGPVSTLAVNGDVTANNFNPATDFTYMLGNYNDRMLAVWSKYVRVGGFMTSLSNHNNAMLMVGTNDSTKVDLQSTGFSTMYGLISSPSWQITGALAQAQAIATQLSLTSDGSPHTVDSAYGINVRAIASVDPNVTVTNAYGVYIAGPTIGVSNVALKVASGSSAFAGDVALQSTAELNATTTLVNAGLFPNSDLNVLSPLGSVSLRFANSYIQTMNGASLKAIAGSSVSVTDSAGRGITIGNGTGHVTPDADTARDLGSAALRFHDGYFGDFLQTTYMKGGTAAGSSLELRSTSGVGITDFIKFTVGSNGGTEAVRIVDSGNVGIGTSTPTLGPLTMASGAYVTAGGTWTNASDRNLKENFATMSPASILQKIDQLPITEWDYKSEGPTVKHIGPVAQDFWSAFQLGNSSTSISTIDPAGVALLGIQALDTKITALQGSLTGNATATNLSVYIPTNFSGDSVGQAQISPGATSVRVTFTQPYQYQPIVTFSPVGPAAGAAIAAGAYITNIDATGFTVQIGTPTPGFVTSEPVTFDWHAFASPSEKLTVSGGTTQPIALIVANSPASSSSSGASAVLVVAPAITVVASDTPTTVIASATAVSASATTPDTSGAVLGASTSPSAATVTPTASASTTPSTAASSSAAAPAPTNNAPAEVTPTPAGPSPSPTPTPTVNPAPPTPTPAVPAETLSPAPSPTTASAPTETSSPTSPTRNTDQATTSSQ